MTTFIVELQGLDAFKETFNTSRIPKQVALGTGIAMKQLHSSLEHAIAARYKYGKPLSSVLVGKSASNVTFGKNVIRGGLEYKFVPIFLTEFFSPPVVMGNINPGKRKKGRVHSVEVIRGRRVTSLGTEHLGGFIPIGKKHMIERDGADKYPTHPLFAPSLSQMAGWVLNNDSSVQYAINNIYTLIENEIQL
jgi:hypothetical protein